MKYIKKYLSFSLAAMILISAMSSCNYIKHRKYIRQIDSLIVVVNQMQSELDRLNTDSVIFAYDTIRLSTGFIKDNFDLIETDSVFLKDYSHYSVLNKQMKSLSRDVDQMKEELTYTIKQLNSLRKDVIRGLLKIEEIERYLADEKFVVERLSNDMNPIKVKIEQRLHNFQQIQPKIDTLQQKIRDKLSDL